jgi:hypothetical protein
MKHLIRIAAASFLLLSVAAFASTTYGVIQSNCGTVVDQPMQCVIDLSPATPMGVYPTLRLTDDLVKDSGGLVDWSSTQGPTGGYLGGGVIQSGPNGYRSYPIRAKFCSNGACITEVSTLTVYFDGTYAQASGGGPYSGYVTLQFSYYRQYEMGGTYKWIRTVTGGSVTIN